jgi:hypothetical protein
MNKKQPPKTWEDFFKSVNKTLAEIQTQQKINEQHQKQMMELFDKAKKELKKKKD